MARTPKRPIAQHIHDQTRTIPAFRRPSSAARPQKGDDDILAHPGVPPVSESFLVVEAAFSLFAKHAIGPVGVATVWCGGGGSASGESCDPLTQSFLPRRFAVPESQAVGRSKREFVASTREGPAHDYARGTRTSKERKEIRTGVSEEQSHDCRRGTLLVGRVRSAEFVHDGIWNFGGERARRASWRGWAGLEVRRLDHLG